MQVYFCTVILVFGVFLIWKVKNGVLYSSATKLAHFKCLLTFYVQRGTNKKQQTEVACNHGCWPLKKKFHAYGNWQLESVTN